MGTPQPDRNQLIPQNQAIVQFLQAQATPGTAENASPWDIDDFELHTHPDLCETLWELTDDIPEAHRAALYGCPVLVNEQHIVCAMARGTRLLVFRLSAADAALAQELGGCVASEIGERWIGFDPFDPEVSNRQLKGDRQYWCERAFANADGL